MQTINYYDWLKKSDLTEDEYRIELLKDVNKMNIFSERLVFHREDEYIVWEDITRNKHYFIIDREDDLNGKWLEYVWDIEYYKQKKIIDETQKKINDIWKRDGYWSPKLSMEEIKELCQSLYDMILNNALEKANK